MTQTAFNFENEDKWSDFSLSSCTDKLNAFDLVFNLIVWFTAGGFDVAYRTEARCQIMIEAWISSLLLLTLIQIVVRLTSITIMSCGKFNYLVTLIPWIL